MALIEVPKGAPSHQLPDVPALEKKDDAPSLTSSTKHEKVDSEPDGNQSAEAKKAANVPPIQNQNPEPVWAHGIQLWAIMIAVSLVLFLMLLDGTIIVAAVPRITDDFHSLNDIGWYGAAYQLGSAVFQPLTGKIYMKFKPKARPIFFVLFEIGSLLCGVANSSNMLIGGRVVAGAGASGMFNGSLIIISECAPMERRPSFPLGFLLGNWNILNVLGFYLNLPVGGVVVALIILVRIPQQHPRPPPMSVFRSLHTHLDLLGFAVFAPALIMLLLACQYGGTTYPWSNSRIIGLFCGAGAMFIVFLIWDYHKGDEAMIPMSIARMRTVWTSCMVYGLMMSNLYLASYWVPVYFQGVKGVSPIKSGIYLLAMIVAHVFAAISSGPIGKNVVLGAMINLVGYTIPVALFASVLLSVGCGLFGTFSPSTPVGKWIGYQILYGVGRGLGIQMPILSVQKTVPPKQIPLAMALITFSQSFGAALFLSLGETIYSNSFGILIHEYAPSVNVTEVTDAGATGFRSFVSGADLEGVLIAYAKSIDRVFYMAAGLAASCFIFAWGMGWKDLRKKKAEVSKV
ncbi:MFS multidrug transporter protein [Rutstroemia sp. NJR-2017a BBW]|nr:MFS multidrug transporter protein [Rutstroemia sp. NJR-2017a BBW]